MQAMLRCGALSERATWPAASWRRAVHEQRLVARVCAQAAAADAVRQAWGAADAAVLHGRRHAAVCGLLASAAPRHLQPEKGDPTLPFDAAQGDARESAHGSGGRQLVGRYYSVSSAGRLVGVLKRGVSGDLTTVCGMNYVLLQKSMALIHESTCPHAMRIQSSISNTFLILF